MKKRIAVWCLILCAVFGVCACGRKSETPDSFMDTYFQCDGGIKPGVLSWGDTQEEIMDKLTIKEEMISIQEDTRFVADDAVEGLPEGCEGEVSFEMEDNLIGIRLMFLSKTEETDREILETVLGWGKKYLPDTDLNSELWAKNTDEMIDQIIEEKSTAIGWTLEDGSTFNISYIADSDRIITVTGMMPRTMNGKL